MLVTLLRINLLKAEDIGVERIEQAAARGTALRIRGGGGKDFYGVALEGEPLDTRSYTGVVDYEPSELVITVRAGTPVAVSAISSLLWEEVPV